MHSGFDYIDVYSDILCMSVDCAYSARCGAENDCALLWIIWPVHSLNMAALLYVEVFPKKLKNIEISKIQRHRQRADEIMLEDSPLYLSNGILSTLLNYTRLFSQ